MLGKIIVVTLGCYVVALMGVFAQEQDRVYASKYREAYRLYELALEKMESGQSQKAMDLLNRALSYRSDFMEAYHQRALAKQNLADYEGALTDYEIVLLLDSTFTEAAFERAKLRFKQNQLRRAIGEFQKVLTMPSSGTRAIYFTGTILNSQDQPGVDGITTTHRIDGDIYNYLGLCYHGLEEYDSAKWYFDQAINFNHQSANYYVNRGLTQVALNQTSLAIADFRQALIIDPGNAVAEFNLTQELESSGGLRVEDYNEMIERHPDFASPYVNRALAKLNAGDLTGALQDYDAAIAIDPHDARIYLNRALAREKAKNLKGALQDFNQALVLDPTLISAYRGRGRVFASMKSYQLAIEDFNEAIKLNPVDGATYFNRGLVYQRMDLLDKSCADLKQAQLMGIETASKALDTYCNNASN